MASLFVFRHNTTVEQPIILRFITDAREKNIASQPRNLVVIGKNAEVMMAEVLPDTGRKIQLCQCRDGNRSRPRCPDAVLQSAERNGDRRITLALRR